MSFTIDQRVFVKHPKKSWIAGYVTGRDAATNTYAVTDDDHDEVQKVREDDITLCREDLLNEGIDPVVHDLLFLTVLHDSTLLRCLKVRYMKDIIYTNIGAIVVALNPFNFKIPWYQDAMADKYMAEGDVIRENLPHSWAVAHNTYFEMRDGNRPQTILVSGESGAGKTEACKMVMKYLGKVSMQHATDEQKSNAELVRLRIQQASPILEGFGNAKTVRNDNSSRFGKFVKVKFHQKGYLTGAFTINYLLEKSRIVTAAANERVYHAFYFLSKGKDRERYGLEGPQEYRSTNAGKCTNIPGEDDAALYQEVLDAMTTLQITADEQSNLWKTVGGCLVMQNVELTPRDADSTTVAVHTMRYLEQVAELWGVAVEALEKELLTTTSTVRGETFVMTHKLAQAVDMRDALCKHLYEKLFQWLVNKINEATDVAGEFPGWIGVLDIFGFEDFEVNSFEQVCINLANETLQNHYNNYIFKRDMEECRAEGICVDEIVCPDNSGTLRLIADNTGVLGLLDEECRLGTGTDDGFLDKLIQHNGKHESFDRKPTSKGSFIIKHYAGNVTYTVKGFLEKNRDSLKDDMKVLMRSSANPFTAKLLPAPAEKTGKAPTVGGFFKLQVAELMYLINSTNPHWIRCVKPHPAKKPLHFDGVSVMNQLSSSGVLGTVKIRKAGYPVRMSYSAFLSRYKIMIGRCSTDDPLEVQHDGVRKAMKASKTTPREVQLGKTRVFMKSDAYYLMERSRDEAGMRHRMLLQTAARAISSQLERRKRIWAGSAEVVQEEFRDYLRRSEAVRAERRRLKELLMAQQRKQRDDYVRDAVAGLDAVAQDESEAHAALMRQRRAHAQWIEDKANLDAEERVNFYSLEAVHRSEIFSAFKAGLVQHNARKLQLHLDAIPEVEATRRRKLQHEEDRYFRALSRLFRENGTALFRGEIERQERRYRRVVQRLEDVQWQEMEERARILPEFVSSLYRVAHPFMADHQRFKAQAIMFAKRAQRRQGVLERSQEVEFFTNRNPRDTSRLARELATIQVGTHVVKDKSFIRTGDRTSATSQFSAKQAWIGVSGVPDIDQVLHGMTFDRKCAKAAKAAAAGRATGSSIADSVLSPSRGSPARGPNTIRGGATAAGAASPVFAGSGASIKVQELKTANVFEVFKDKHDELQFLRMRHLISLEFKQLAKLGVYSGPFSSETEIPNKRTFYQAQDHLQSISMAFAEELVAKLRKLNSFCISREIPDQDRVTGVWSPYRHVPQELLQTYPPCTDWKRLLEEEERVSYVLENYRIELLKIIRQCIARGAKIPVDVDDDSSIDRVHSTYFHLIGHFKVCKRCLFPMAPKKTLVQLRTLWPHVQDAQFPDVCSSCMTGAFGKSKTSVQLLNARAAGMKI